MTAMFARDHRVCALRFDSLKMSTANGIIIINEMVRDSGTPPGRVLRILEVLLYNDTDLV